jgi:hypothetical protein
VPPCWCWKWCLHQLSPELTNELTHCATIGIGAGKGTAGQVLVLHDMLGMNLGKNPKFVRNFMQDATSIRGAMEAYVAAVKNGSFPVDAFTPGDMTPPEAPAVPPPKGGDTPGKAGSGFLGKKTPP